MAMEHIKFKNDAQMFQVVTTKWRQKFT